jgi:hypothetical protein
MAAASRPATEIVQVPQSREFVHATKQDFAAPRRTVCAEANAVTTDPDHGFHDSPFGHHADHVCVVVLPPMVGRPICNEAGGLIVGMRSCAISSG